LRRGAAQGGVGGGSKEKNKKKKIKRLPQTRLCGRVRGESPQGTGYEYVGLEK